MDDDSRTTGMGLWTDAREMFQAATLVINEPNLKFSSPAYYLLGHGLEVALKSYLRSHGRSLKDLRAIGHDLSKALQDAVDCGLVDCYPLSDSEASALALFTPYYKAKHFEYRVTGYKQLPSPQSLLDLGNHLLAAIRPICEASVGVVRT